jgi:hypothetical protein
MKQIDRDKTLVCIDASPNIREQLKIGVVLFTLHNEYGYDIYSPSGVKVYLPKHYVDFSNYHNPVKYLSSSEKWANRETHT